MGSRRVYEGHVVSLRVDDVELPSGHRQTREVIEHRGAVAVVPLIEGDVFLVRQFRRAAGRALLEIPAGSMEAGEEPEACLQRELAEEIGMRAGQVTHMVSFYPSPGFLTEVVHVYVAYKLSPHRLDSEEEDLEVVRLPLARARALVGQEIVDAKSIIGLLLASDAERAS
ncbi:MAG TPA: NUDIX hydrolase [bacterium]|nr:NUDIX hydrolase [bacterium]